MFTSSFCEYFSAKLVHHACDVAGCVVIIKHKSDSSSLYLSSLSYVSFGKKWSQTIKEYSKIVLTSSI